MTNWTSEVHSAMQGALSCTNISGKVSFVSSRGIQTNEGPGPMILLVHLVSVFYKLNSVIF